MSPMLQESNRIFVMFTVNIIKIMLGFIRVRVYVSLDTLIKVQIYYKYCKVFKSMF